jgi:DNA excision repair protein ERCC-3
MSNPCVIVQSNMEVLLNVDSELHHEARDAIAPFTELVKSPEHFHTYSISHLSLWNAASTGLMAGDVLERLKKYSAYEIPANVEMEITEYMQRYGILRLKLENGNLVLESDSEPLFLELCKRKEIQGYIESFMSKTSAVVSPLVRGKLKIVLTELGFPVQDIAGYVRGEPLEIELNNNFTLRDYQRDAAQVFHASGSERGGSGVIVLPCGSGKTIIGMAVMALVKSHTLILTPSVTAARQWIREILQKTTLTKEQVKEYSGDVKEIGQVTVATYQILTQRKRTSGEFSNFSLFESQKWGLMIYDEVHLLPAPVFRFSADMQATRRLGLTATLVREDHRKRRCFRSSVQKNLIFHGVFWRLRAGLRRQNATR